MHTGKIQHSVRYARIIFVGRDRRISSNTRDTVIATLQPVVRADNLPVKQSFEQRGWILVEDDIELPASAILHRVGMFGIAVSKGIEIVANLRDS